jgi:hypothetical protein
MTAVRVDRDPGTRAGFAPGHHRAGIKRGFEQVAPVQGEADGSRAVVSARAPAPVTTAGPANEEMPPPDLAAASSTDDKRNAARAATAKAAAHEGRRCIGGKNPPSVPTGLAVGLALKVHLRGSRTRPNYLVPPLSGPRTLGVDLTFGESKHGRRWRAAVEGGFVSALTVTACRPDRGGQGSMGGSSDAGSAKRPQDPPEPSANERGLVAHAISLRSTTYTRPGRAVRKTRRPSRGTQGRRARCLQGRR